MKISGKVTMMVIASLTVLLVALVALNHKFSGDMITESKEELHNALMDKQKTALINEMKIYTDFISAIEKAYIEDGESKDVTINDIVFKYIKNIVFGKYKTGYAFVMKPDGTYVMHPKQPELNGKNGLEIADKHGVKFIKEYIRTSTLDEFVEHTVTIDGEDVQRLGLSQAIKIAGEDFVIAMATSLNSLNELIAETEEHQEKMAAENLMMFIILAVVIAVIALILTMLYSKFSIIKPLNELIIRAKNLSSGDGDLTKKLEVKGRDEIAQASSAINDFIEKVRVLIANAKSLSSENSSIANELSSTSLQTGKRVEESTEMVTLATQKCSDMQTTMSDSVELAKVGKSDLQKASEYIATANHAIQNLSRQIMNSAQIEGEMALKIEQLSKDADQVKSVLDVINDIADQTNLLALNAAIEAARAGEHGRGFAVVADEVRKLAERTQSSLTEINATISVIVQAISNSSEQMTRNSKQIQELTKVASDVEETIRVMGDAMNGAIGMSDKTTEDFINTGKSVDGIMENIANINALSTENARSVQEIAAAAEHLNKMTDALNHKLGEFRT
ncbi:MULTISPECIES: methyl-accepting chemotaxis protein [unclassified Campylobacter]|uniref:methyl-accepting chemotaxis protein n=1 Tax=unclassified Campylobacter TaxID=2593542 RepID=UPI003D333BA6